MELVFTEITVDQGNVAKKYSEVEGKVKVKSAATIYSGKALVKSVDFSKFSSYLNDLCDENKKCITLGIPGDVGEEFELATVDNVTGDKISRSKKFFSWVNHGSVGLLVLDFDTDATNKERNDFLSDLDMLLTDALIGETGNERTHICKWMRGSTSAGVKIKGKQGNGLHVFLPIKGDATGIVKLIHQWCWLNNQGWKLTKAATILSESLIDPAVGSPERVLYSSDAEVDANSDLIEKVERTCSYTPGGVLDAELTRNILEEVTVDYKNNWTVFRNNIEKSEAVRKQRRKWKEEQISKRVSNGMDKREARLSVKGLMNRELLSTEELLRNNGDLVSVKEILLDPDQWLGVNKFCDPVNRDTTRNVGMIMGSEERPFLNSMSHGGVKYWLKWTFEDLYEWCETCPEDELEDWFLIHSANCDLRESQINMVGKVIGKRMGASGGSVSTDIKADKKERQVVLSEEKRVEDAHDDGVDINEGDDKGEDEEIVWLPPEASHGDIIEDYLRRSGDCKAFGDGIYVWKGGSVWKCENSGVIQKRIRTEYNHVSKCQRVSDYKGLAGALLSEADINVERWDEAIGFPCSDGFYRVTEDGVEKEGYTKELLCRFKMGIKPDFEMKTPMFDKIVDNVENPVLFQQLCGLALCGKLPELQKVFIMFGDGGAGKGTISRIMSAMLPKNRATSISLSQMNDEKYRVLLADSRVNFTSEISSSKKVDVTGVKEIVGGDLVTGRALFQGPVSFYPCCTFVLSMNRWFPLGEVGDAVQRRFGDTIVRFKRKQDKQIGNLVEIIIENELPGVLAWCMDGIDLWIEHGLESSLSHELWGKWISSVDPIQLFVEESIQLVASRSGGIKRSELWDRFKVFCEDANYYVVKKGDFFHSLESIRGFNNLKMLQGHMVFRGVKWV